MASPDFNHSTKNPANYFGRASATLCTTRCDLSQWPSFSIRPDLDGSTTIIFFETEAAGANLRHFMTVSPVQTGGLVDWDTLKRRAACNLLVNLMPDKGLSEMWSSLRDMYEFHSTTERPALPAPARQIRGTIVSRYVRPPFVIE